jgi:hypothetical protein
MVMEVDGSRLRLEEAPQGAKAALELTILAVARDRPTVVPLGETINVALTSKKGAEWWTFVREVRLPPGVAQIRATVRDHARGPRRGHGHGPHRGARRRGALPGDAAPHRSAPAAARARDAPHLVPTARAASRKGARSIANTSCSGSAGATCRACPRSRAATPSRPRTDA